MERKRNEGEHIEKDYYKILEVDSKCSQSDIEESFKKLSREWHPEKHPENRVEAQNRFNQICEAYTALSDVSRRHQYD
jgi:molecular chaperone DnaJ